MKLLIPTTIGKSVRHVSRLRGGGSALPGLVVEKLDPNYLKKSLANLPFGVVVISGTNGKTTTTKIVVELLESAGLKVFTNKTGSNFTRGVIASMLAENNISGKIKADIAVLELDEAHAIHFINQVQPRYSLLLNVMRDQLDRFGEVDYTASLLEKIAQKTTEKVITNREDTRLVQFTDKIDKNKLDLFGLAPSLKDKFPNDDELYGDSTSSNLPVSVELSSAKKHKASFTFYDYDSKKSPTKNTYSTSLKLEGIYNIFNATAALALVREILNNKISNEELVNNLGEIEPAFGRGETIMVNDTPLELVLVKNPAGFQLGLNSFSPKGYNTMIALNDAHADGRDLSWLWDVNFNLLKEGNIEMLSGIRAYDMALRLSYDDIPFKHTETDLKTALEKFLENSNDTPKRIFCSYTAMLEIRHLLEKITDVKNVGVR
ncbi:DUF1727 domain-containing protein [Candidatus Saccharibacteria bacterium]|nr:DUF1727 domain-containing protein [Candidatus Saccharibacteria bacterium]MBP9985985.1 DUF1727 domain-containing protein [Candidatus Saccharibacteria bacterium]